MLRVGFDLTHVLSELVPSPSHHSLVPSRAITRPITHSSHHALVPSRAITRPINQHAFSSFVLLNPSFLCSFTLVALVALDSQCLLSSHLKQSVSLKILRLSCTTGATVLSCLVLSCVSARSCVRLVSFTLVFVHWQRLPASFLSWHLASLSLVLKPYTLYWTRANTYCTVL